jgi:hypothetical protein
MSNQPLSVIDLFYDNRKNLYDICGKIINKEKYKFIDILSTYLTDIVDSIDSEIKQSTRNSMINWREKKNPKLLSKFINSDDNINIINRSMNKITATNYMVIVTEITETLTQDNFRKLPDYSKFLFDTVIKKCLNDESFTKDYLNFLVGFDGTIGKYIGQHINQFILEMYSFLEKNNDLKSFVYFSYVKDITHYANIGIIFSNLYIIQNEKKTQYKISDDLLYEKFGSCLGIINNFLDWMPSNIDELTGRIYMMFSIFETVTKKIFGLMKAEDRSLMNNVLNLIYNVNSIPNKIKFKVLDIQDIINTMVKANSNLNISKSSVAWQPPNQISPSKSIVKEEVELIVQNKIKIEEILPLKINITHTSIIPTPALAHRPELAPTSITPTPITPKHKSIIEEVHEYNPGKTIVNDCNKQEEIIINQNINNQNINNQNRQRNNGGQNRNNGGQNRNNGGQNRNNGGQNRNNGGQNRNNGGQNRNNGGQNRNNDGQNRNNDGQNRNRQRNSNSNIDYNCANDSFLEAGVDKSNTHNNITKNKGARGAEALATEALANDGFIKIERKNKNSNSNISTTNINSINTNNNLYKLTKTLKLK